MSDLRIRIDSSLIVSMIRALDDVTDRDDLHECLYDHGRYLCDIAGDVSAIRALENAAMDRDLTDAEFAALNKCRQSNNPWIHRKAGIILQDIADIANDRAVCDVSEADERPGQDAGAALVDVECYVWCSRDMSCGDPLVDAPRVEKVVEFRRHAKNLMYMTDNDLYDHARPVRLGKPTP